MTDVADAMILTQYSSAKFGDGGCVVVATTSNSHPSKLYEGGGGVNGEYFLQFIDMLEKYCVVHHLGGGDDFDDIAPPPPWGVPQDTIGGGTIRGREKKCGDYFYLNTPPEEEEEGEEEEGRHHRGGASSLDLDELFSSLLRGGAAVLCQHPI